MNARAVVLLVAIPSAIACLAPGRAGAAGPSVTIGTIGAGGLTADPAAAPTPHARENAHRSVVVVTPAPVPAIAARPGLPPSGVVVIVPNVVPGLGGRPPYPPPTPPGTLHRWSDDPWRR